jgi:TPR repeat protein
MVASTTRRTEIARLKRRLRQGHTGVLIGNIAAAYRALGNRRRAFDWWCRAADDGDGDACVEVGYCLQYGIGVRRNPMAAAAAYQAASRSRCITEHGREEALYHLAVVHLDDGGTRGRSRARTLLRQAAADGDYPAAIDLLAALEAGRSCVICRCRRGLRASLGGRLQCGLHAR